MRGFHVIVERFVVERVELRAVELELNLLQDVRRERVERLLVPVTSHSAHELDQIT